MLGGEAVALEPFKHASQGGSGIILAQESIWPGYLANNACQRRGRSLDPQVVLGLFVRHRLLGDLHPLVPVFQQPPSLTVDKGINQTAFQQDITGQHPLGRPVLSCMPKKALKDGECSQGFH